MKILLGLCGLLLLGATTSVAQNKPDRDIKMSLNDDGSHYIKLTFTAQVWARYNENNPGTTVFGFEKDQLVDIGLRRVRTQFFGKIHDKIFFYTQLGINNFNAIASRKAPIFFHDVLAEYSITPRSIQVGMGLTAWTGFARFSSPAVASIMGYDAPLFEQSTNDANDQFLRKLSIYAKGKLGKLDYRFIVSDPFAVQNSSVVKPIGINSDFSYKPTKLQTSSYIMYQFLDEESNLTPYLTGTYLGKKKILNIGAGYQYQSDAMWHWSDGISKDTVYENMFHYAVDLFYDHPLGSKGSAISIYTAYMHMGFGKNYIRNLGVMNPADGVLSNTQTVNGAGNAFPMMGTGNILFAQFGYLLPYSVLGEKHGQLQLYTMLMYSNFDRLKQPVATYDLGLNWYIDGYRSKLSLNYQNRPVFSSIDLKEDSRKSMIVLQFQIAI